MSSVDIDKAIDNLSEKELILYLEALTRLSRKEWFRRPGRHKRYQYMKDWRQRKINDSKRAKENTGKGTR